MSETRALQQSPLYAAALTRLDVPVQVIHGPDGPILVLMRRLPLLGRVALTSRPVGRIDADQVADYARRKQIRLEEAERWLAPVLGYAPGNRAA